MRCLAPSRNKMRLLWALLNFGDFEKIHIFRKKTSQNLAKTLKEFHIVLIIHTEILSNKEIPPLC